MARELARGLVEAHERISRRAQLRDHRNERLPLALEREAHVRLMRGQRLEPVRGVEQIDAETATNTVNILLKYQSDIAKAVKEFAAEEKSFNRGGPLSTSS